MNAADLEAAGYLICDLIERTSERRPLEPLIAPLTHDQLEMALCVAAGMLVGAFLERQEYTGVTVPQSIAKLREGMAG